MIWSATRPMTLEALAFFDDSFLQVQQIEFSDELAEVTIGNVETLAFVFDQLPSVNAMPEMPGC